MLAAPSDLERGTIVVLPSATFPEAELRKIVGIQHYEERLLCTTLRLANPEQRIVYITSLPLDEAIIEYYLSFLPDPADARTRLHLVAVGEDSQRALSAKVLDAPGTLEKVRGWVAEDENAYLKSHSWADYATWHLGLTDSAADETKSARNIHKHFGQFFLARDDVRKIARQIDVAKHVGVGQAQIGVEQHDVTSGGGELGKKASKKKTSFLSSRPSPP